ncbi:MAG: two pore domain potassium channel family protein [Muribaculum sp.]|nr:two pore domain potassium channel family protein [Muribaculum sp.]
MILNHVSQKTRDDVTRALHLLVIVLSLGLIVWISVDTFTHVDYLENKAYMHFQGWVCAVFMLDFIAGLLFAEHKWKYLKRRWFFFLLSVPYLNIIAATHWQFTAQELYFLRFIPLVRGALALSIVVGYMTTNRITSVFMTYIMVCMAIIYFSSLIFMEREMPVNPQVTGYFTAITWAFLEGTTLGSSIYPVTAVGKVLSVILGIMGTTMFPLFTVYVTTLVQRFNSRHDIGLFNAQTDTPDQ